MTQLITRITRRVPRAARVGAVAASGALLSLLIPMPAVAQPAPVSEGLVCTQSLDAQGNPTTNPSFVLKTATGYIKTPDGNNIFMLGYANGNGSFQYPGPVLCVNEGDNVSITLRNSFDFPTSLIFPGIKRVLANGRAEQLDLPRQSLAQAALAATTRTPVTSITYTFKASSPGTYLYESGTDPEIQVQMGMVGAIVVRPALKPDDLTNPASCASLSAAHALPAGAVYAAGEALLYDDCRSAYNPQREFMHLLTEIDPHMHVAIEKAMCADVAPDTTPACVKDYTPNQSGENNGSNPTMPTYDMTRYVARYFMINGRAFPDDITPNFAPALPQQPYGALVHVNPKNFDTNSGVDYNPLPAVVRFLSGGPVTYPFHPHSNHDQQVGTDGRMLADGPSDVSFDRFGFVMAPGQTAEALFNWTDGQGFASNPPGIGVPEPNIQNRTDGQFWAGTPYLGVKAPLNAGKTQWNACGEYYQFAHSHALFQITNYGASGGGMLTLIRVDPSKSFQAAHGENCDNNGPGYGA